MAKEPRHVKMYKDSPTLERDEETGKPVIKKPSEKAKEAKEEGKSDTSGMPAHLRHAHERREMHHRHHTEHHALHHKHEHEHAVHEQMGGGHKGPMHDRHEMEKKELHKKHEHEHKVMHEKHEKEMGEGGKELIAKTKETAE